MTIEMRPRVGIAARLGSVRAGLRALLGSAFDVLEVSSVSGGDDVDLWIIDGEEWEPVSLPYLLLSDTPGEGLSHGQDLGIPFGVLRRNVESDALRAAVHSILAGLVVLEPDFLTIQNEIEAVKSGELTTREQEVLQLLALGLANKQIAARLGISIHTAKFHAASILAKLGAASRTEAVTIGAKRGWIVF